MFQKGTLVYHHIIQNSLFIYFYGFFSLMLVQRCTQVKMLLILGDGSVGNLRRYCVQRLPLLTYLIFYFPGNDLVALTSESLKIFKHLSLIGLASISSLRRDCFRILVYPFFLKSYYSLYVSCALFILFRALVSLSFILGPIFQLL